MMRLLAVGVFLATMTGLAAERPKVESPFDLEFGSDAVAKRFPAALSRGYDSYSTSSHDGETSGARTNRFLRATVDFAKPYHLFASAELKFRESDQKLYECHLNADCPEKMTREECVKTLEEIVREMNDRYGLKLKLKTVPFDEDSVRDLAGKRNISRSFVHAVNDYGEWASNTNDVSVSIYGMVNGKGGMSVCISMRDDNLANDFWTLPGRFFEGFKPTESLTLPQGYSFGDVYTNVETTAVIPDCLTNWPGAYGMTTRCVPLSEKWRDFDRMAFYLTDFGRIGMFAAVLSTNGIDTVEALEKWGNAVLDSRQDELGLEFIGDKRFTKVWGRPDEFRTAYVICRPLALRSLDRRGGRGGLSAQVDLRRMADGQAFLRVAYSSDAARKLDEPQRSAAGLGIREALKDLFALDFETETTNRADYAGRSDWERLAVPKGPFAEWMPAYLDGGRMHSARLRCVYPDDVTRETLSNAVWQVVHAIEAKAGVTIPVREATHRGSARDRFRSGETLSPGDWFGGTYPTYEGSATVGDMSFEISCFVPQYVKEGDAYRPCLRGGFVFRISRELKLK